nr:Hypothetical protein [Metisa plana]
MTVGTGKIPLVLCVLVSSLCIEVHAVSITDQMAEITQLCCNQGLAYAKNHTSQDCSSSVPPDVPVSFGSLCISAMDGCCKEYFMKKHDCEDGVQVAIGGQCHGTKSDTAQDCCTECMRGHRDGAAGACSGRLRGGLDAVVSEAYAQCCQEAIKGSDSRATSTPKNAPTPDTDLSSICEEYAPNELCAHHCIPVPGSYRCECNPGYMLMADGRNCKEVQKNRCKPKIPASTSRSTLLQRY